jgi:hypothetical protein
MYISKIFLILVVVSMVWAGGVRTSQIAQARDRKNEKNINVVNESSDKPATSSSDISDPASPSMDVTILPTPTLSPTVTPTPVASSSPAVTETPSPTPTATPAPQLALGFLDLFKKPDPPPGTGHTGLNFLSAVGQDSVYQQDNPSAATRRSLYGAVIALVFVGISTFMYGRSKHTI